MHRISESDIPPAINTIIFGPKERKNNNNNNNNNDDDDDNNK